MASSHRDLSELAKRSEASRPGSASGLSAAPPALLPAFEPLSSSPSLPRPIKRKHNGSPASHPHSIRQIPTPVPTSSTSFLSTSPPRVAGLTRPGIKRTVSTVSERVPLGDVPSLELSVNGQPTLLGRSSNSSQYQLPASRLISRVHVRAWFEAPCEVYEHGRIMIECVGWNGMKVLCRGGPIELGKYDTFSSSKPDQDILADIQDTRVMIRWPALARKGSATSSFADQESSIDDSPSRRSVRVENMPSSPPVHLQSPVSPLPHDRLAATAASTFLGLPSLDPSSPPLIQVYEDHESDNEAAQEPAVDDGAASASSMLAKAGASQASSELSSPPEDFSDHEEENDPIVHSFGPFGDNLLPRMASFRAVSPERRRAPLRASVSPQQGSLESRASIRAGKRPALDHPELGPIRNHVINQLAYSRLHSVPISTILQNLPLTLKGPADSQSFTADDLQQLLDETPCIGEIVREGKDAAGKPLENEYYYLPELDADAGRKDAVELGKPGLRAVRKQHKQYFWKRPRH